MSKKFVATLTTILLFALSVWAQKFDPGTVYKTPGNSKDGSFLGLVTYPIAITEGSSFNVTWKTTLSRVDIYSYYQGNPGNTGISYKNLSTNTFGTYWGKPQPDPFVLRIVEAEGDPLGSSGFWSTSVYINKNGDVNELIRSLGLSTTSTSRSSVSSLRTFSATQALSTSVVSSTSAVSSTTPATSSPVNDASPASLGLPPTDRIRKKKLAIGLGVGFGALFIILVAVAIFARRRQRTVANGKDGSATASTGRTSETQKYAPVSGIPADQPELMNSAQAVQYQDEWVRDRT
ncbi:hypothetical protein CC86DRAFT_463999 [Ophiobolus disseminans]|uniref:Mid2 domain-containing protein n=1 Tax=Ophiobolus disseminans TaxID=1469910 RepID=A0A6A7ADG0_9PLEO|nr:hypothetical protein CC86DRAFT_463999 [Ophiobolus disseminans]